MQELSKYFKSESAELLRSEIHPATYNPRTIDEESKKTLKRGIRKFGLLGGIIVNKRSGMTVVSGHQRLSVMDELNKFPANDYTIRVDVIDVGDKEEKELNILMNNPNAQGAWDYDALRELMPDIDYRDAGLTDEDLNLIGVDFLLQTDGEDLLANALDDIMQPVQEQSQAEKNARKAHMKEVKAQVKSGAEDTARNIESFVTLSFDTYAAKSAFMNRFGFQPIEKFIKGEVFADMIERVV